MLDRAMDIPWSMREELQSRPGLLNLGKGFPRRLVERNTDKPTVCYTHRCRFGVSIWKAVWLDVVAIASSAEARRARNGRTHVNVRNTLMRSRWQSEPCRTAMGRVVLLDANGGRVVDAVCMRQCAATWRQSTSRRRSITSLSAIGSRSERPISPIFSCRHGRACLNVNTTHGNPRTSSSTPQSFRLSRPSKESCNDCRWPLLGIESFSAKHAEHADMRRRSAEAVSRYQI
jgi:hypothetical protein